MKKEINLTPSAVVCRRSADCYDGELVFNNVHYIVAQNCPDRSTARKAAVLVVEKMKRKLRNIGAVFVAPYPKAKP